MADVASKQQTKALFFFIHQSNAQEDTKLTKKLKNLMGNCAMPENIQFSFSCSSLHS